MVFNSVLKHFYIDFQNQEESIYEFGLVLKNTFSTLDNDHSNSHCQCQHCHHHLTLSSLPPLPSLLLLSLSPTLMLSLIALQGKHHDGHCYLPPTLLLPPPTLLPLLPLLSPLHCY